MAYRIAATLAVATLRGVGIGTAGLSAAIGLVAGESLLTRARVPKNLGEPPDTDGTLWCAPGVVPFRPALHLALVGDSLAAGLGAGCAQDTTAGRLALGLSTRAARPVRVSNVAVVGSRSRDLRGQVDRLAARQSPDVVVVIAGANDVIHHCASDTAVRRLTLAVHRLEARGAAVVVGTCPDVGTAPVLAEPLRHVARRRARSYARAQALAVRNAGGRPVDLFTPLGAVFRTERSMFAADGYHPSGAGYAAAAQVLLPVVCDALGLSASEPRAA